PRQDEPPTKGSAVQGSPLVEVQSLQPFRKTGQGRLQKLGRRPHGGVERGQLALDSFKRTSRQGVLREQPSQRVLKFFDGVKGVEPTIPLAGSGPEPGELK